MLTSPVTALIYTRVSTDEQTLGYSLDAQLEECRRYAARREWVIGSELQDVLSGRRDDRPAYQTLLAEVRRLRAEGSPAAVVVAALDRLGRRLLERIRSREELKALGVSTHSVREGGEVSDLVANILGATAQEESRRFGERVLASRDHIAGRGWKPSGRAPWGYLWRPATDEERALGSPSSVLDVDPLAAPYVQEAYRMAATTHSVQGVARWVAGLPSEARGGRNLRYCAVRDVLSAAVYIGRIDDRSQPDVLARQKGRWPALVDDAIWLAVQQRIASHRRTPRQATGRFVLTGLIRCTCGSRMVGMATSGRTVCYACTARMRGAAAGETDCRSSVHAGQLEAGVLEAVSVLVERLVSSDPVLRAAVKRAWDSLRKPAAVAEAARRRSALEREVERARKRLTDAARLLVDGVLDRGGYEALRDEQRGRLEAAEQELARLHGEPKAVLPPLDEVLTLAGGWGTVLTGADTAAKRDVLALLVETVTPERVGWGKYRPKIAWTPLGEALARLSEAGTLERNSATSLATTG